MEASVAIQVLPQNTESDAETCRIVDEAIAYIMSKFPDAYVGPFETAIEGDYDLCMVATYAKIFYAPERGLMTTEQKVGKYHESEA